MQSILDILINEVASVLGISREEVLNRFTKEELDDLLNNSLCQPVETIGPLLDDPSSLPCSPAPPEFLPEIDLENNETINNILKGIEDKKKEDPNKCVDSVKEVNKKVQEQTKKYNDHRILLEKLLEYRDSFIPIKYYFEEKSKEAARVFGIFSPLLIEKQRLEGLQRDLSQKISRTRSDIGRATADQNYELANKLRETLSNYLQETNQLSFSLINIENQIEDQENTIPIFRNEFFKSVIGSASDTPSLAIFLGSLASNFIDSASFQSIKSTIESYSETIKVGRSLQIPNNIQEAILSNYFTFNIEFPGLNYLELDQENYNEQTGARTISKINFYIKTSQLLEKNSFFKNSDRVSITQYNNDNRLPIGSLYTQYYNLFEDPINNFFQLSERGLTEDELVIDSRVKGTAAEKKKEAGKEYFVQNLDILQNFYQNFEESLSVRLKEIKNQRIVPLQNRIQTAMQKLARQEIQLVLALGGVNRYLPTESQFLNTITERLKLDGEKYANASKELDEEIARIEALLVKLKPTPDNVKKLLKESNSDCFKDMDRSASPCPQVSEKLGSDPFGIKSLKEGTDATLPNQNQLCYWLEFSKVLNLVGLLPIPNLPDVTQLRYWPVGLVITTPTGIVKIPLPIIYLPLIVISTPLGNLVFFLTINGLFISPVVFFVSSSGFKQLIVTSKGSSEKFGYDKEDSSIKSSIQMPISISSSLEKARKNILESLNGKDQHLSEEEKSNLNRSRRILKERLARAEENGNEIEKERVQLKLKELDEASQNKGFFEKLEDLLNKKDSPRDLIDDFKRSINKSLAAAGQPSFRKSQEQKQKIINAREEQRKERRQALIEGNKQKEKELKEKIDKESTSLEEKIQALEQDLLEFFDKIKFPKVRIPKNKETIDPKQNSIVSFIEDILDFSELYGTQFFSIDEKKVGKKFLKELARANDEINEYIAENLNFELTIDLEKDPEKGKSVLKGIVDILIEKIKGKDTTSEIKKTEEEITKLTDQLNKETDRIEKIKLTRKIRKLKIKVNSLNGEYLNYATNVLSPTTIAGFDSLGVDFNPFSPCCNKPPFSLNLDAGPTLAILEAAKAILLAIIDGYDKEKLIQLFGGKTQVTQAEIKTRFTGLIKNIPEELVLPIPSFDAVKFLEICSKIFLPLFEPKAPILAAQPALPVSIVIDLNLLKEPLLKLLLAFFKSLLPTQNSQNGADDVLKSNQGQFSVSPVNSLTAAAEGNFDNSLKIVDCSEPDELTATQQGPFSDFISATPKQTAPPNTKYAISNTYIVSPKSVYPPFQNILTKFTDINPEDLVSLIVNFFNLNLEKVVSLLEPFYALLNTVKPTRETNLNVIEAAQYKVPPYGPPNEARFTLITKLKQEVPKSANFKFTDIELVKSLFPLIESALMPIASTPLPAILVAGAGAIDSILPQIKAPAVDSSSGTVSTQDLKINKLALRQLHPILNQDDLPPWERLTAKNILFLLFLDDFAATTADQVGFFRSYI